MRDRTDIPLKGHPGLNGALWALTFVLVAVPVLVLAIDWLMHH